MSEQVMDAPQVRAAEEAKPAQEADSRAIKTAAEMAALLKNGGVDEFAERMREAAGLMDPKAFSAYLKEVQKQNMTDSKVDEHIPRLSLTGTSELISGSLMNRFFGMKNQDVERITIEQIAVDKPVFGWLFTKSTKVLGADAKGEQYLDLTTPIVEQSISFKNLKH